jgi:hypothetical protein
LASRDQRDEDGFQLRELILPASGGLKLDWIFVVGLLFLARPERHERHGEYLLVMVMVMVLVLVPVMQSF